MPESSNLLRPRLLLVDDAPEIRAALRDYLIRQRCQVEVAASAAEARELMARMSFHLVILDIMMPGENGFSLCRHIVSQRIAPVILLSALSEDSHRIKGLDLGADDYLPKPFNPRELLARIQAVLRRVAPELSPARRVFAGITHDPRRGQISLPDGSAIELTTAENRLLGALLDHPGRTLSRDELAALIRGGATRETGRTVDNTISRLRRKIGDDPRELRLIVTEWGGGYRLAVEVRPDDSASGPEEPPP